MRLGVRLLKADEPLAFGGHGALDEVEVVEGDAGAHGDAFEGVVGDVAGDADLLRDQAVEVAEEGGAAGEDDAAVDDVGGELRGGALEDRADGADDRLEGVLMPWATSVEVTVMVRGRPVIWSRPRTW